ncbi:MAG: hypothetical protein IKQ27_02845 [Lachnospiraceae bacterium]|nr:hypothetical protein [Lachnospiraceae bacterium]
MRYRFYRRLSQMIVRTMPVMAAAGMLLGNAQTVNAGYNDGKCYYEPGDDAVVSDNTTEEERERIEIKTAEDLIALAEQCHIDSFSADKDVVLTEDIRLGGSSFTTIPIFCGHFDGNGHTVYGVNYGGDGYVTGFFRYIGEGAVVENLNIDGTIRAEGKQQVTGGVCGINSGTIINCSFDGHIYGKSETGGIAGVNTANGEIRKCVNNGSLSGYYFTGGISGKNYGMIYGCGNTGNLNDSAEWITEEDEMSTDLLQDLTENGSDVTQLRRQSGIDTGGIAGYSKGAVISCTNDGTIGYEHAGYNIGGIIGRQTGLVTNCSNRGMVLGRKDIGGIVGQMEPYLELNEEDSVHNDVNDLHDMIGQLTRIMDSDNAQVKSDLDALMGYADSAVDAGGVMADQATDYVNENMDLAEDAGARVSHVLEMMPGVTENMTDACENAMRMAGEMQKLNDDLYAGRNISGEEREKLEQLTQTIETDKQSIDDNIALLRKLASENTVHQIREEGLQPPVELILDTKSRAEQAVDAVKEIKRASTEMKTSMESLYQMYDTILHRTAANTGKDIEETRQRLGNSMQEMEDGMESLQEAQNAMNDITAYLNAQDDLQMIKTGEEWDKNADNLQEQMDSISAVMTRLGDHAQDYGEDVNDQIRAINDQINQIYNDIYYKVNERIDGIREDNHDYIYADISDGDIEHATLGKAAGSINYGVVRGDVNVGGITGSMAIDEEDPEGSAAGSVQLSIGGRYTSRNIIYNCTNRGYVTSKNDGAGGIVGFMKNGVVSSAYVYGAVESTEGGYVGGVAGQSLAIIRDSYVLCTLSGADNVGGIAGSGVTITGCYAMPTITDCTGRRGAIAGQIAIDEDTQLLRLDQLSNNHYVSEVLYGIDRISYQDAAEPMEYEELLASPGTPIAFHYLTVTFRVGDRYLGTQRVNYGDPYSTIVFPEIPAQEGSYGKWPEIGDGVIMGNMVITGEYVDSVRVIESLVCDPQSGKQLALIDNDFNNEARLSASMIAEPAFQNSGYTGHVCYSVRIENSGKDAGESFALRLYNPYGTQKIAVWCYDGNRWNEIEYLDRGSYVQVEMQGLEGIYCIAVKENNTLLIAGIAGGTVAVILLFVIVRKIRKKRKMK